MTATNARSRAARACMVAFGVALLTGCAQGIRTTQTSDRAEEAAGIAAPEVANQGAAPLMVESMPAGDESAKIAEAMPSEPLAPELGQTAPQLVKQASLVLVLTDVDGAVAQVQQIVQQTQGDLLNLQDYRAPEGRQRQVTLTLRVPQAQLDTVLNDLRSLGTVEQQSLTAEDVSSQLVDLDARLRNLRQSEVALQKIMERTGEISHVLDVARELSTVRDSIERIAAEQQNLQRRVAYSQVDLTLQSPLSEVPPLRPVRETLGNTWQSATLSVQQFTVTGLQVGLWLLAYSPYLVLVGLLVYGGYRLRQGHPSPSTAGPTEPPLPPSPAS